MVRHERLVMLATLALLQVLTVVTGVYAMNNDLDLSALSSPTEPTASPEARSPRPRGHRGAGAGQLPVRSGDGPLPTKGTLTRRLTDALGTQRWAAGSEPSCSTRPPVSALFASRRRRGHHPRLHHQDRHARGGARLARPRRPPDHPRGAGRHRRLDRPGRRRRPDPGRARRPRRQPYPEQASLAALASRTATALKARGVTKVTLSYDDSLFTGSPHRPRLEARLHPRRGASRPSTRWRWTRAGRTRPHRQPRVSDPPEYAAAAFAELLRRYGVTVGQDDPPGQGGPAAPGARPGSNRPPSTPSSSAR